MKYRIYVDETGNPDLKSSDDPNHRFLILIGVIKEASSMAESSCKSKKLLAELPTAYAVHLRKSRLAYCTAQMRHVNKASRR